MSTEHQTPLANVDQSATALAPVPLLGRVAWVLRNDLRPQPAWHGIKQRLLELLSAVMVAGCGLLLIPLAVLRLLFEPVMIVLRPLYHALFNGRAVERLMTMHRNHDA